MVDAIGFNMGQLSEEYLLDDKVDIVGNLDIIHLTEMKVYKL